ncbi:MAG: WD40 repeat domain-containing protein [Dehalococcoidia bacterium]
MLSHLTQSAQAWEHLGRDSGELYRGARLAAASEWAKEHGESLNALEKDFVGASLKLNEDERMRDSRRLRRLRTLVTALAGISLLAVVGTGVAFWQWNEANNQRDAAQGATLEATLARLETEIPLTLKKDRSLAFLLARQAYNLQPGPRTSSLLDAVLGDDPRWLGSIQPSESLLTQFSVSPDGKYLALATQSGLVELHDASTYALLTSERGAPGLTQNSYLVFVGTEFLVLVVYGDAAEAGVTVFSIPNLNVVRKITWDRSIENFGGVLPASGEVAILREPESGSCCQTFRIIRVASGDERTAQLPQLDFPPNDFLFDAAGKHAAIYLDEPGPSRIAILNAKTFEVTALVSPAGDTLRWYDLSGDGKTLVTAYSFGVVQAWDTATGELLGTGNVNNFSPGQFTLSKSGRELVATTENLSLLNLSVPDFSPLGPPFLVGSSNGSFTIFGAEDDSFFSFDVPTNAINHWSLDSSGLANTHRVDTGLGRSAFAPDGAWMVKQALDGSWTRWSLPGLEKLNQSTGTFGATANNRFSLTPIPPLVSADGRYIVTTHTDCAPGNQAGCSGRVVLWNAASGEPIGEPVPVANPAQGGPGIVLAMHPQLPIVAIGASVAPGSRDVHIDLWNLSENGFRKANGFVISTDKPAFNSMVFSRVPTPPM